MQGGVSGHTALVVDDNPRIRQYIRSILEGAGAQVLEAGDGLEALEVFNARCGGIDLVITDIRMPRMTGMDLAIALRSACPAIPVILVSGEPAPVASEYRKDGNVFIEKPFGPAELLAAARRFFDFLPVAS